MHIESQSGGEAYDPNDKWSGHEPVETDWELIGCFLKDEESPWLKEQVEVDFKAMVGDEVFVVYVRYSTGDSFGCTNGAWNIVQVCETYAEAEELQKSILDKTYKPKPYMIDGREYQGYIPWDGYFESLESCSIDSMRVK